MRDPDDLTTGLRKLAQRLDQESRAVDPQSAMGRPSRAIPARRGSLIGAAAAVVLAAGFLVVMLLDGDDPRPLQTTDTPNTLAPDPSTTTSTAEPALGGYAGTPLEELPDAGIAVVEEDRLILLGYDGTELGVADTPLALQLGTRPGLDVVAVRWGAAPIFELAEPDPAEAPSGCDGAAGGGGVRVALCGGAEQLRERIISVDSKGESRVLAEAAPGSQGAGHWRWAIPSPDGRWVLAQWSGECEVPTAFLVPTDGGEIRTASGQTEVGGAAESTGVGWTPDGQAIVRFHGGLCGSGLDEPGTYLVDPVSGQRTLVRTESDTSSSTYIWRQEAYGNALERSFGRALRELGLGGGCCGEPSHGGDDAVWGAQWEGVDIPLYGAPLTQPVFVPFNDLVIASEPIEIDGSPATAGEADLGAFVSFSCGANLWSLGGAGLGDRATPEAVRALAAALIPHLYCTMGERPQATGHGTP